MATDFDGSSGMEDKYAGFINDWCSFGYVLYLVHGWELHFDRGWVNESDKILQHVRLGPNCRCVRLHVPCHETENLSCSRWYAGTLPEILDAFLEDFRELRPDLAEEHFHLVPKLREREAIKHEKICDGLKASILASFSRIRPKGAPQRIHDSPITALAENKKWKAGAIIECIKVED